MSNLNLITKSALMNPSRVVEPLWWAGHIPFVMWLVETIKPLTLVELGTHTGNSYFAMCHSVKSNGLPTHCYAVDTWQGDLHQGSYEDDVYRSVKQYNDSNYSEFSTLLRMTFDKALPMISERTIDLLHIDGLHTYEAVRHDLDTWLPKLSDQAVVLFHDTTVRKLDFGVWRLWEELSVKYPNVHFDYSQGLGVLFVGEKQPLVIHDLLNFWSTLEGQSVVHQFFAKLGKSVEFEYTTANLNQALAECNMQIANLNQAQTERERQAIHHQQQHRELQELVVELRNEIEAYHSSTSWRITRPLREVSHLWKQLIRLARIYQNYRHKYPGVSGVKRMFCRSADAIRKDGINGLRNNLSIHQRVNNNVSVLAEFEALQSNALQINSLHSRLEKSLVVKPVILFDHNGGGGSNNYTRELVKIISADGGNVLRIYYFEAAWFILWIVDGEEMLYYTPSIEELFDTLLASCSTSIVVNSLYGYPDIAMAVSNIVTLSRTLCAALDYKIHDFYALCPSPHLSDFEDKYCGVPQNFELCPPCLKKNFRWYHSWYPKNNMPVDIREWRKPFATLFEAATTVTFFDCSSVEIVHKAFNLDDRKIKITPHLINYFNCDTSIDVTGALHIGIIGTLSDIKGGGVVKALFEHIDRQGLRIPLTVVGHSFVDIPSKIKVYGHYKRNDLPVIVRENHINVILMPTIVPETFSYTISEAMQMGLPIVAFDIGAQGCRVKEYALGKVIPLDSAPEVILSAIQSALKIAQELQI